MAVSKLKPSLKWGKNDKSVRQIQEPIEGRAAPQQNLGIWRPGKLHFSPKYRCENSTKSNHKLVPSQFWNKANHVNVSNDLKLFFHNKKRCFRQIKDVFENKVLKI